MLKPRLLYNGMSDVQPVESFANKSENNEHANLYFEQVFSLIEALWVLCMGIVGKCAWIEGIECKFASLDSYSIFFLLVLLEEVDATRPTFEATSKTRGLGLDYSRFLGIELARQAETRT